jgi:general L-amino acid transport system substrate-binding protein
MWARTRIVIAAGIAGLFVGFAAAEVRAADTATVIKERGKLRCGVNTGSAGFSAPDSQGNWKGLDVDTCRALAAVMLGDKDKVEFVPTSAAQRIPAIQSGEVDILARNTTMTMTRDTAIGLKFGPVTFYDGQAFIVPAKLGVNSVKDLNGATICVAPGTTTELNLADYFRANKLSFTPVLIQELADAEAAFLAGRCDAYTADRTNLAIFRMSRAGNAEDYKILPESISKEPLAPIYRQGDDRWGNIIRWTVYALLEAEERGVTQANVADRRKSEDPNVRRLLGSTPGMGKGIDVDDEWAYRAISAVGNYGEIFDRHFGARSPLKLDRGLNRLWTDGGLMYAMPIR